MLVDREVKCRAWVEIVTQNHRADRHLQWLEVHLESAHFQDVSILTYQLFLPTRVNTVQRKLKKDIAGLEEAEKSSSRLWADVMIIAGGCQLLYPCLCRPCMACVRKASQQAGLV